MRHARRKLQRIARLAAVGGLVCGGLMVSNAMAGESAGPAVDPVTGLVSQLGTTRTAGSWVGADGRPVVAVTDEEAAEQVRQAGADAKLVRNSMSRLRAATEALGRAPRVPGTAWAVDYASNKVVVRADSTVSKGDWSRMSEMAKGMGGSVEMQRSAGNFTTRLNDAVPIFAPSGRCSAGFNVTNGQENFILTAGHCGPVGTTWFRDTGRNEQFGTTTAGAFPGNDFSLVRYEKADAFDGSNNVEIGGGRTVRIVGAADPVVGQRVFRSGSTTGFRSGKVTALNATVNYREGTVTGLIETTVCAERGDSGGPLFSQGLALGVTSGGNGDCSAGGTTFFQPATKALAALGVKLTGGSATSAPDQSMASGAIPPGTPPEPGATGGGSTVTGILDFDDVGPGLVVIVASLSGLVGARWILSAQERRNFRSFYNASWG